MPVMNVLTGIPASGKSTFAKTLPGFIINSTALRPLIGAAAGNKADDVQVFRILRRLAEYHCRQNREIVVDATNLTVLQRRIWVEISKKHHYRCVCYWFDNNLSLAMTMNEQRERKVPRDRMVLYNSIFEAPSSNEGFSSIIRFVMSPWSAARTLPLPSRAAARPDPHACQRRS